ncbi:hypothetical protein NDU88_006111 [Pleurodeles waltl]|uniref:Uncharacterized protein n=1 Tax=Pleurodeles waltl TaxID=8319 RepID=A0AAV7LN39_PLEWA|nr:hypothetical protein NDU88_006111 [Pleurodeles waltl]
MPSTRQRYTPLNLRPTPAPQKRGTAQPDPEVPTSWASALPLELHRTSQPIVERGTSQTIKYSTRQSSQTAAQSPALQAPGSHPGDARSASLLLGLSTSFLSPVSLLCDQAWRPQSARHTAAGRPNLAGQPPAPRSSRREQAQITSSGWPPTQGQMHLPTTARARPPREAALREHANPRGTTSPLCALGEHLAAGCTSAGNACTLSGLTAQPGLLPGQENTAAHTPTPPWLKRRPSG